MTAPHPKQIICMKWGTLFPAGYVNALYSACRAHTTGPLRFICMTDNAQGIHPEVEIHSIPEIGLQTHEYYTPGVWPKLSLFSENLCGLTGKVLFIDLDMMILGSLDPFFKASHDLTGIDVGGNWHPHASGHPCELGTGVFYFTVGAQTQILKAFQADKSAAFQNFQNEQDFVAAHASEVGYWPKEQVSSFKRFHHRRYGAGLFMPPRKPAPSTAIVAFHGAPRPIDIIQNTIWGRFPHFGAGTVDWIRTYWTQHIK